MRTFTHPLLLISALAFTPFLTSEAADAKYSGFLSVIGGKVLSGNLPDAALGDNLNLDCPCYIADWANAGVYDDSFSLSPETHLGVQADVTFSDQFRLTAQVLSRTAGSARPKLEWFYASYDINPDWTVQVGRKRIPLYFYSEFQDIGIAYPWVTPPAELYGWEATNYNGVSIRHVGSLAGADTSFSFFSGSEKTTENRYQRLYYTQDFDVDWNNIVGGDFQLTKGWFTGRLVYVRARPEFFDTSADEAPLDNPIKQKMKAYGLALNADFGDLFFLTEIGENDREYEAGYTVKAPAGSFGAGYRIGAWTPFLNWGYYHETTDDLESYSAPARWKRLSLTLRYDWSASTTFKAQYDRYTESEISQLEGDAKILRLSLDKVF